MLIVDTHCDSISNVLAGAPCIVNPYNMSAQHMQFAAAFTDRPELDPEGAWALLCDMRAALKAQEQTHGDVLALCRTVTQAMAAVDAGKKALFFSMEGASALAGRRDRLDEVTADGLRCLSMTWNQNNIYGCANTCSGTADDTGLTSHGRQLVRDCNNRGILLDVSHASDNTTRDILCTSTVMPVVATHSNFRAVAGHKRNLTDQQALGIKATGGVVGLNIYIPFLGGDTADAILRQLDYGLELLGEDHIGFGFDLDGIDGYPAGINDTRSVHEQVVELLQARGYSDGLLQKLAHGNWLRVLNTVCP